MLKTVELLNVFVEIMFFSGIFNKQKVLHLFLKEFSIGTKNVTFDGFNTSLLNKSIKEKNSVSTIFLFYFLTYFFN